MFNSNQAPKFVDDDSLEQINRDKEIRAGRSKFNNKYKYLKTNSLWKKRLSKYLIDDLINYGPANVMHMNALSKIVEKSIRIFTSDGNLYRTINNDRRNEDTISSDAVNIEYHQEKHWTLLGNKEPTEVEIDLNACLFAVIAAQTGRTVNDLRTSTIEFLTNNENYLIDEIDKLSSNNNNGLSLMVGGARYNGRSPKTAAIILDRSQNVLSDGFKEVGHPRGHACDTNATGAKDSVENYSRTTGDMKSGFLSKYDQNEVTHYALSHQKAQQAMDALNAGEYSQALTLFGRELPIDLPKMKEFVNGEPCTGELNIVRVTLVLRHHIGKRKDRNADVFVHTIYPRSS